jgi:L-lactate dehydrogenase complex protein LldG
MAVTENPSRERILSRIQNALRVPAHKYSAPSGTQPIFAPIPDLLDRFQKECVINITECVVTPDHAASAAAIAEILARLPEGEIYIQETPQLREMSSSWTRHNTRWSSEGGCREVSQATITHCEALVAMTGSVLVSSACGGRGASVVAPIHIVVAGLSQLVPDLSVALAQVDERGVPKGNSFLCLTTGSSRTADIEKILVMGAHGPRRLVVVIHQE